MPVSFLPSANIELLQESATIAVSQRARALKAAGRRIVDLGAGEPDFDTPLFIREAAALAMNSGATRYTATDGILPLRQAVATHAATYGALGHDVQADEVVISNGSKQSIFNACFVLFGAGDEVLIPTPSWTSYYEIVQLARATPVSVFGSAQNELKVTAKDLELAASPRTKGVMINSPCNPTGAVYGAAELRDILALAHDRGWWVISDEIYRRISYGAPATSAFAAAPSRDNLILIDGVAKAYAMTGWRVGWSIAPRDVSRSMTAFQSHATFHTASMAQHGALAALQQREASEIEITKMVHEYQRRRDAGMAVFGTAPELQVIRPDGAFYFFVDVSAALPGEADAGTVFARQLLEDHGVAVVPGAAFKTPGWIRASYATSETQVIEGVTRIVELWTLLSARHKSN